jgi:three-Cys-motif partner protein
VAKRLGTTWRLPPHTRAKHAILRGYLDAWLPIMGSWNRGLLVIDGFAGPGRYEDGEDGSPIIALKAALEHRLRPSARLVYLFIEENRERKESLDREITALALPPNFAVHTHLGRFDETLNGVLDEVAHEGMRLLPTFAFVDPCGWSQTPFRTIERLLTRHRAEVLINFMYEEINRFILVPEHAASFDHLFGTPEWRGIASMSGAAERRRFIRDLYGRQLRTRAGARFVRSFEMRNDKGATDYFLYFATSDQTGLAKMKEAMWRVDPGGAFAFSDATDPQPARAVRAGARLLAAAARDRAAVRRQDRADLGDRAVRDRGNGLPAGGLQGRCAAGDGADPAAGTGDRLGEGRAAARDLPAGHHRPGLPSALSRAAQAPRALPAVNRPLAPASACSLGRFVDPAFTFVNTRVDGNTP